MARAVRVVKVYISVTHMQISADRCLIVKLLTFYPDSWIIPIDLFDLGKEIGRKNFAFFGMPSFL